VDESAGQAVGMNSITKPLGGEVTEALLLILAQSIEGGLFASGPRLKLRKEGREVTTLNSGLGGNLASRKSRTSGKEREKAVVQPGERGAEQEVATADSPVVGKLQL